MENNTQEKAKRKFKAIYLLIIIPAVFGSLQLWASLQPYPGNDRNVEVIDINETYIKDELTCTITEMELGDNFAVVYFQVEPAKSTLLDGLQVCSDGEPLKQYGSSYGSEGKGDMAFYVPQELGQLEIKIYTIENINTITTYYPLEFEGNKAQVEIEFDGHKEIVEVKLFKDSSIIIFENSLDYPTKGMYTEHYFRLRFKLVKAGNSANSSQFSKENIPDELQFEYNDITYSDDVIVIPVT